MEEEKEGVGKEAVKFKTWIQVAATGVIGIIQLSLILKPEVALHGTFSIVILAALIIIIIYSDFKTRMAESELKKSESKARRRYQALKDKIPIIELMALKKGASMALQEASKSFREDAKSATTNRTRQIYIGAAKLVSRHRRLLQKMQEIAKG